MSFLTPDQLVAAQKANIETLFGLTQKTFEGVEKLVELNLQVARSTLGDVAQSTHAVLSVKTLIANRMSSDTGTPTPVTQHMRSRRAALEITYTRKSPPR